MGLANKLTLFLTASGVSAAAVYALSAFARSHRTGELRKMAEDVRGKAREQSVPEKPDPAPDRPVDPPPQDAALNRVLEEGTTLDELADMGVLYMAFSGGEPLMYKHFFELGACCRDRRRKCRRRLRWRLLPRRSAGRRPHYCTSRGKRNRSSARRTPAGRVLHSPFAHR